MNSLINTRADSLTHRRVEEYGMGIHVVGTYADDAQRAYDRVVELGAWPVGAEPIGSNELIVPAIQSVGGTYLYLTDRWHSKYGAKGGLGDISIYGTDFWPLDTAAAHEDRHYVGVGPVRVDHLMQTVGPGHLQDQIDFYRNQLGSSEVHELHASWYIVIDSYVMVSSCRMIRILLYEEGTHRAHLVYAYLPGHPGEGVQHIALATDDTLRTATSFAVNGLAFVKPPTYYYDTTDACLPGHGLSL